MSQKKSLAVKTIFIFKPSKVNVTNILYLCTVLWKLTQFYFSLKCDELCISVHKYRHISFVQNNTPSETPYMLRVKVNYSIIHTWNYPKWKTVFDYTDRPHAEKSNMWDFCLFSNYNYLFNQKEKNVMCADSFFLLFLRSSLL